MCCNNMWFYIDMSHFEWAVCGYEGFLVLVSLLYIARGWSGRVVRSKKEFGLPGDYSEMSLPSLRNECM